MTIEKKLTQSKMVTALFFIQGIYYLMTGIWPVLDIESFIAVTGPKIDIWLVKTVGMLVFIIGAGFILTSLQRSANGAMTVVATACIIGFIVVDVGYVVQGVIHPIYLLDAVLQSVFLVLWSVALVRAFNYSDFMDGEERAS